MLYGVEARSLNQAVTRNRKRFPTDFLFQLSVDEYENMRSQIVTPGIGEGNSSQTVMSSWKHRGRRYRPYAFTEHGALQAANILNSPRAVQMSVFVIRAFVKIRDELGANSAMEKRLPQIDNTLFLHDSALRDLYQKLRPLLAPPAEPAPKPRIGFSPSSSLVFA